MSIELENAEKVLDLLKKVGDPASIVPNMGKACALVERTAKDTAPKKSGDLRRSIQSRVEVNGNEVVGIIFTPLEYAPYVEYGTGIHAENDGGRKDVPWAYEDEKTGELIWTAGQHPQPYLRPALIENRDKIKKLLGESLND